MVKAHHHHLKAPLAIKTINKHVLKAEYAVRGEIVSLAQKIDAELRAGKKDYPFDKIVSCNIGNPQILGQKPVTYFRQVLAICEYPGLLEHPEVFPPDVIARARELLEAIPGGIGAYSESAGAAILRKLVSQAIEKRDGGAPCDPDNIFLTDGASPAVHYMMDLLLRDGGQDGLMVPIPQYPLYSATLTLYGGKLVPYMLDEANGWGLDTEHLKDQLAKAREEGTIVRGMVVINPGNPTGQCLSYRNQEDILRFCKEEDLVLIADEVYQTNIWSEGKEFNSFKKVAYDLGLQDVPMVSLHSISKGFVGECGRRGGYMELTGFPEDVKEQILKLASINLCPNLSGQICCALMMNPPQEGEASFALYDKERLEILGSLKRRAELLVNGLNKLEGVTCNAAEGALYAFPRITLPQAAVEEAARIGKQPDWLYCHDLLLATGIVVVPGSGFGQADGTFHFRTTFLPSEEDIGRVVESLSGFHASFMAKYGGVTNGSCANGKH